MTIHYQPIQTPKPVIQEFVNPVPDDYFIWWLFKRRCVDCKHPATEINEIVLRSRSKKALCDYRNRVTMCRSCHEKYHHDGVTTGKIESMRSKRKEFLMSIGRELYV